LWKFQKAPKWFKTILNLWKSKFPLLSEHTEKDLIKRT
jgi:hypothetical protein